MASAFETVALAVKQVFEEEFEAEGFTLIPDKIHESLGRHRVACGIHPEEEGPNMRNRIMQETFVEVRLYDLWTDEINPETQINPFKITGYAEMPSAGRPRRTPEPARSGSSTWTEPPTRTTRRATRAASTCGFGPSATTRTSWRQPPSRFRDSVSQRPVDLCACRRSFFLTPHRRTWSA
jgi:hypothetical protein